MNLAANLSSTTFSLSYRVDVTPCRAIIVRFHHLSQEAADEHHATYDGLKGTNVALARPVHLPTRSGLTSHCTHLRVQHL